MDCEGDGYFHSYDDVESHRLMLRDTERVEAYRRAIEAHKGELQGAAVVDVGAGTGFLACLVAKIACPRVVYAVEASGVAEYARQIADNNGLSGVVRVIRSRMEEAELPEPVDAVISEWMGFHLLHESMLDSVLCARDRFLKQNGIMLPGIARLYASPVSMDRFCQEHFYFWDDVCGVDMSAMVAPAVERALSSPLIRTVDPSQLLSEPALATTIDLHGMPRREALTIDSALPFPASKEGYCHGFAMWFEVDFGKGVKLSTSPHAPQTHWRQSVVLISEVLLATPGARLDCRLKLAPDMEQPRHCVVTLEMGDPGEDETRDPVAERERGINAVVQAFLEQTEATGNGSLAET